MAVSKLACVVLVLGACASPARRGRRVESLAKLRKDAHVELPAKLPTKGISYGNDGTELDLDVDAGTVTYAGQDGPRTVPVLPADVSRLWAEAEDVWRDPKPKRAASAAAPTRFLAIVDHDDAYYVRVGPDLPASSSARRLIDELVKVVPPVKPDPVPQAP